MIRTEMIRVMALAGFVAFAMACGGDDQQDAVKAAQEAAAEASAAAQEAAGEAAAAAREAAAEATDAAKEAAQAAGDAAGDAAAGAAAAAGEAADSVTGAAAVTLCKELAGKSDWISALDVCKAAHEHAPDDMAVEHALQQAEAAAKAGS